MDGVESLPEHTTHGIISKHRNEANDDKAEGDDRE